jgi:hypothetical protein
MPLRKQTPGGHRSRLTTQNTPPPTVVINEMTTVASVWTNAQFFDGTAI